jgi:hypothetical protein
MPHIFSFVSDFYAVHHSHDKHTQHRWHIRTVKSVTCVRSVFSKIVSPQTKLPTLEAAFLQRTRLSVKSLFIGCWIGKNICKGISTSWLFSCLTHSVFIFKMSLSSRLYSWYSVNKLHNSCRLPNTFSSSKREIWLRPNWWGVTTNEIRQVLF